MATITEIKKIATASMGDLGVSFHRTNPVPLDGGSYFFSLDDAKRYAQGQKINKNQDGATAFVSQQLYVLNEDKSTVDTYVIQDVAGNLIKLTDEREKNILSNEIDKLWQDSKGGVNYQGHVKTYREHKTNDALSLSFILALYYDRHDGSKLPWLWDEYQDTTPEHYEGLRYWLSSIPLRTGWMYCMTINEDYPIGSEKYTTKDGCEFTDRDYMIIHNHDNPELTSIQLSDITRTDIDIIETQDSDYVRLPLLNEISNALSTDYVNKITNASCNINSKIDSLSTALSNEITSNVEALSTSISNLIEFLISADLYKLSSKIDDIHISAGNISIELSNLEVSVAGISNTFTNLCVSLSTEISSNNIDIENILNYISGDNSLCTELSNVKHHYNKTFSEVRYTKGGTDLNVDVLNITNSENLALKFNLIYLSGTLVLEPII